MMQYETSKNANALNMVKKVKLNTNKKCIIHKSQSMIAD